MSLQTLTIPSTVPTPASILASRREPQLPDPSPPGDLEQAEVLFADIDSDLDDDDDEGEEEEDPRPRDRFGRFLPYDGDDLGDEDTDDEDSDFDD